MGHSSGGYMIPADRSHLHFEIGVVMHAQFPGWYDRREIRQSQRTRHVERHEPDRRSIRWRSSTSGAPGAVAHRRRIIFAQMETAVRLRIAPIAQPDFVTRYPSLLTKPVPFGPVAGWEITVQLDRHAVCLDAVDGHRESSGCRQAAATHGSERRARAPRAEQESRGRSRRRDRRRSSKPCSADLGDARAAAAFGIR